MSADNSNDAKSIDLSSLQPSVTLPPSLKQENLTGVALSKIQNMSADIQGEVLSCYAHMLRSIAGRKNKGQVFTEKRQRELFQRCLSKVIAANPSSKDGASETSGNTGTKKAPGDSQANNHAEAAPKKPLSLSDAISAAAHSSSIKLPLSHLKLEAEAAKLFHSLPWEQQQSAVSYCDEAALSAMRQGCAIQQPTPFFKATLDRFVEEQKPKTTSAMETQTPSTPAPEPPLQVKKKQNETQNLSQSSQPKKQTQKDTQTSQQASPQPKQKNGKDSQASQQKMPLKEQNQQKAQWPQQNVSQSSQTKTQSQKESQSQKPEGKKKKNPKSNPNQIQILQKNNNTSQMTSSKPSTNSPESKLVEELRRELQQSKELLETKTKQLRDQTENNKALKKLWEQEQYMAKASKERIQKLEDTVQQLQQQLHDKDVYVDEQLKEAREIKERKQEEQLDYREMVSTFSRMSKELCDMQQEKREVEKALETHKAISKAKNAEILRLRASLKMLRPTAKHGNDNTRTTAALRKELKDTQDRLAKERSKSGNSSERKSAPKGSSRERPSLADFVLGNAPDNNHTNNNVQILRRSASEDSTGANLPPNVQILQRSASTNSNPLASHPAYNSDNTNVNVSLEVELPSEPQRTACQEQQPEPEGTGINFDGVDKGYDSHEEDEAGDRIKTELDFLLASFGDDEVHVESDPDRITRVLQLHCDRNDEVVEVHLILTIHDGYPESVPLEVEASLAPDTNPSVEARKVAMDALPGLVDMCRWEANGSVGNEALFAVLQIADQWVQDEWHGIQAKRLAADSSGKACLPHGDLELCRMLISSHHIVESEKITFVKNKANSYDLGGYLKSGYPGYVLVEGLHDNCNFFVETIIQQRMKLRNNKSKKSDSATFTVAGKILVKVEDLDGARTLPKKVIEIEQSKEGMQIFEQECKRIELEKYLDS